MLGDGAFGQRKAGVIQKAQRDVVRLFDIDPRHMAVFGAVGAGADRPEVGLQHLQADPRLLAKQRAAPASWAEGRDRCQCQQAGAKRHHRAMR